jgi:general secretion pathway protein K
MRRRRQRGIALVLVTWVFMILGVLAFDFARYMRDDAMAALNLAEETSNYYVAIGAMNRVIYDLEQEDDSGDVFWRRERPTMLASRGDATRLGCAGGTCVRADADDEDDIDDEDEQDGDDADADAEEDGVGLGVADGEWHEDVLNDVRYGVRVTDEGSLISLNDAAHEQGATLLRHVVKNLLGYGGTAGTDRRGEQAVSTVVDSIVDWYDRDDNEGVQGAESSFYLDRDPPFPAKNGDFDAIEELLQIRGVTPELYYGVDGVPGLKDIFSPYIRTRGEHPKVSLRRAPAPVLQVILNIDAEEAAELIEMREEQEILVFETEVLERLRTLDPVLGEQINRGGSPKVVRVEARADVSKPRNQARVAAVIELSSELTEGIRIVRWFDRAPWQGTLPAGTGDGPA